MSAAAAIGTGFALSAASAFRRGGAGRAIARVVAPRRAGAAEVERQAAAIRHSTRHLEVLVPAHWQGSLAIRGTRWRGRGRDQQLTGFSVVADDPSTPGHEPRLEILHDLDDMPPVLAEEQAVATVAGGDSQRTMPDLARLHETGDQRQLDVAMARWRHETERREQQLRDAWEDDHVHVDGHRVPARRLAGKHSQAVVFEHDHRQIMVSATGLEPSGLELTATSAIEPLLDEMTHRTPPAARPD